MKQTLLATAAAVAVLAFAGPSYAGMDEAKKWVDNAVML